MYPSMFVSSIKSSPTDPYVHLHTCTHSQPSMPRNSTTIESTNYRWKIVWRIRSCSELVHTLFLSLFPAQCSLCTVSGIIQRSYANMTASFCGREWSIHGVWYLPGPRNEFSWILRDRQLCTCVPTQVNTAMAL